MGILSWIVLGLVAGWLAGQFMQGGYGLVGDVVLGIVGAIVGGFISGASYSLSSCVSVKTYAFGEAHHDYVSHRLLPEVARGTLD